MTIPDRSARFVSKSQDGFEIDTSASYGAPLLARRKRSEKPAGREVAKGYVDRAALARKVAVDVGISQTKAEIVVNAILTAIRGALTNGEDVRVARFGTFTSKSHETQGHSEPLEFRAAKCLREAVD
jgi:Bacterial DNA-binding protein